MPWHFGGDPWLTWDEGEAYAEALKTIERANEKADREAAAQRASRARRR